MSHVVLQNSKFGSLVTGELGVTCLITVVSIGAVLEDDSIGLLLVVQQRTIMVDYLIVIRSV